MPENEQNLGGIVGNVDLSAVELEPTAAVNTNLPSNDIPENLGGESQNLSSELPQNDISGISVESLAAEISSMGDDGLDMTNMNLENVESASTLDENVFLDTDDNVRIKSRSTDGTEKFGKYLRIFFVSSVFILLGVFAIVVLYSFNTYITRASQTTIDADYQEYVTQYKDKYAKVKTWLGMNNKDSHPTPSVGSDNAQSNVNEIINATDIDYIEKKDLLSPYVSDLIRNAADSASRIDVLRQEIARQGFLPEELDSILSDDQAIDTIQRSLNALEVIKFSTATKVFSYMNTALYTIAEMVRVNGSSPESIGQLLTQLSSRGEKDISSYVYMCYLNPFETNANCDVIGDLDLYYNSIIKDNSINISLFKNTMNAINQLLEKEDTALFSITFNGFNAQDKSITFNIEVYTNQSDEKALIAQGKKNPNIFILTNIINLLKQSSFIIGAEINTREVNVETRTLTLGGISSTVNYSSKDFTVPIQKDTEREIFDYIDLDSLDKLLAAANGELQGDIGEDEGVVENTENERNNQMIGESDAFYGNDMETLGGESENVNYDMSNDSDGVLDTNLEEDSTNSSLDNDEAEVSREVVEQNREYNTALDVETSSEMNGQ